jgi:hypothetical protein
MLGESWNWCTGIFNYWSELASWGGKKNNQLTGRCSLTNDSMIHLDNASSKYSEIISQSLGCADD